ncbi:MAG TPA: peptide deformylase [Rhodospirillales bacterium]|nr:peptide deformylase [Rhodospirillales bacterium]
MPAWPILSVPCLDGGAGTQYLDPKKRTRKTHVAVLPVIIAPDPRLKVRCQAVERIDAEVRRAAAIQVRYLDRQGKVRELAAEGLLATCIQHEMDHLDGVLFVDHISALKRNIILRKLTKMKRAADEAAD